MCCTLYESRLSNTILYWAATEFEGRNVHVMAYQNRAANLARGPNAMLLPIPAAAPLSGVNAIDTTSFRDILRSYARRYEWFQQKPVDSSGLMRTSVYSGAPAEVFQSGSYTVVMAKDARAIPDALKRVPDNRRPKPNPAIFEAYAKFYPGWHIALCCYDGRFESEPILFWYEPLDPSRLFAPALDAHDGAPPKLESNVARDHYVFFGSREATRGMNIGYSDGLSSVPSRMRSLFLTRFAGTKVTGRHSNGDFWLDVRDLSLEDVGFETLPPPGALT